MDYTAAKILASAIVGSFEALALAIRYHADVTSGKRL